MNKRTVRCKWTFFFKFTVNVFLAWLYAKIEKSHEICVYEKHWQIQDKTFFKKIYVFLKGKAC